MTQHKYIGRQFTLGIAKEATRGTGVAPSYWLEWETLSIDDEITSAKDEGVIGVIEKGVGQETTFVEAKGSVEGRITDLGFGLLLKCIMGTDTVGAVETGVKDHVFTVLQSAQHPTLTFTVVDTNSNTGSGYAYALGSVDSLEMTFEIDKYAKYKAGFTANKGASLAATTGYTLENAFRPQDGTIKIASNLSGLSGASAINITKATVSLKQNVKPDKALGNIAAVDRLNEEFVCSGSLELKYYDRTFIDTYLLADAYAAFSFVFANSAVTIGAASNPTLTVSIAKCKLQSVARKIDPKGIITQMVKFDAFYSLGDTEMLSITLRNTVTSAY